MTIAKRSPVPVAILALAAVLPPLAHAQSCCGKAEPLPTSGSTSFCLYEVPAEEGGKRRWINLGIVQYVEAARNEVKIGYGGGRFGSGYEARIPVANAEEAFQQVEHMRKAAAACR